MKTHQTKILSGKPAASGIGIGNAVILSTYSKTVLPEKIDQDEIPGEITKFRNAREVVGKEYEEMKILPDNKDALDIIDAQIQTLRDPEVERRIEEKIRTEKLSAEYSIFSVYNEYIQLLETSSTDWANERAVDVASIRDEVIDATRDKAKELSVNEGEIVFAEDISPTIMVKLSHLDIGGIVIQKGGLTSHVVILSQSLGIPCVINARWDRFKLQNGVPVIIDGATGQILINPTWKQAQEYKKRQKEERLRLKKTREWVSKPDETKCGHAFSLRANVEFLEELKKLKENGAKGIGLLRTETILFETEEFNVDDQIDFYSTIAESTGDEPVTIRLFDAGGDKLLENSDSESNPFLGWRGVRMLLDEKELLIKQLKAIYTVSGRYKGKVKLIIPMVSRAEEIIEIKSICDTVCKQLEREGVAYDTTLPIGVMVEVPSIVLTARNIAKHVDFFSLGTNDLTQYTLAVDRGNEKISDLFDSFHPAIWTLIKMSYDAAKENNIPISVCGEMASYPEAAACLFGMGITELSMNSGSIPAVKSVLCTHTKQEMTELAEKIILADTLDEIHNLLAPWRAL